MTRIAFVVLFLIFASVNMTRAQAGSEDSSAADRDYSYVFEDGPDNEQEYGDGETLIRGGWLIDFAMSTVGFNLGGGYDRKVARSTYVGFNTKFFWVRGNDEAQFFYSTINNEDIIIFPAYLTVKRRLLNDVLSSSFRPYASVGVGGVYGIFIDGQKNEKDHRDTMFSGAGFGAVGADFGTPGTRTFGIELKYEVIRFPHNLGERDKFDNFQIGFHFLFN